MNAEMAIGRKLIKGLALVGLLFAIGCGKSEEQKTEDLVQDGNNRIGIAKNTISELSSAYGIDVGASYYSSSSRFSSFDWSKYTSEERKTIRNKLKAHSANCRRIVEIANSKNVYAIGGGVSGLSTSASDSDSYVESLDSFERNGGAGNTTKWTVAPDTSGKSRLNEEGNRLIDEVNVSMKHIRRSYQIDLNPNENAFYHAAPSFNWSRFVSSERREIKGMLERIIEKVTRIKEIERQADSSLADSHSLSNVRRSATLYLTSLRKYEGDY